MNTRVFVYGSLKRGGHNHRLLVLGNAQFIGEAVTRGTLFDLGPYPAVSIRDSNAQVHGEIYEVDDATFQRLDQLEGYPSYYNRDKVETSLGPAWIYTINDMTTETSKVVKSGNWTVDSMKRHEEHKLALAEAAKQEAVVAEVA
jgi:gamma-glutamylcyclotransferase (GGCT)/AIG2-like uncharacterized protein YtfP